LRSKKHENEEPEIRVTDRRRIYLDHEISDQQQDLPETVNLKPTYVEELETRTKAAEQKAQEVQSRFEQVRAQLQRETDETRQRLNRAADERAYRTNANMVSTLLPVLDDLQRAIDAADKSSSEDLLEGVRKIAENFTRTLQSAGVETFASVGEPFDPELHEAVETEETDPGLEGKVIAEYTPGYKIGERLLRPARVKVGRGRDNRQTATSTV
jgi:molecular chaperone GrpE